LNEQIDDFMDNNMEKNTASGKKRMKEEFQVKGNEVLEKVKEIIQKGNANRIKIKQNDKVLLDIPVNVGAVGMIVAPYVAAFGVIAALVAKCSIEIEKND